jgi:hypothetical protein
MRNASIVWASALAALAACNKTEDKPANADKPAVEKTADKPTAAPEPAKPPPPRHRIIKTDEIGRGGASCTFARFDGTGASKVAVFALAVPPGREVKGMQTWVLYYNKAGKLVEPMPDRTFYNGEKEQPLGIRGSNKLPKDLDTVECEITEVFFADRTFWWNDNLIGQNTKSRPKGGFPEAEMRAHSGEKVTVDVLDPKTGRVRLKNVADKPTHRIDVNVFLFLPDHTHAWASANGFEVDLKPGESAEKVLELSGAEADLAEIKGAQAAALEATVPEVRFADDSEWNNQNLRMIPSP